MIGLCPGKHMVSWTFCKSEVCLLHPPRRAGQFSSKHTADSGCLSSQRWSDWERQLPAMPTCSSLPCPMPLYIKDENSKSEIQFLLNPYPFYIKSLESRKSKLLKSGILCYMNEFILFFLPNTYIQCLPFPLLLIPKDREDNNAGVPGTVADLG